MKKEKKEREEKNTTIKYSFFSHEKYQVFSSNLKQVKLFRDLTNYYYFVSNYKRKLVRQHSNL